MILNQVHDVEVIRLVFVVDGADNQYAASSTNSCRGTPRRRIADPTIILVTDCMMNMSDVVAFRLFTSENAPLAYSMAFPDVRFATRNIVAPSSFGGTS